MVEIYSITDQAELEIEGDEEMTTITLKISTAIKEVVITDEHPASNGKPVAVVDGKAYGPLDFLPIWKNDELSWLNDSAATVVAAATIEMRKNGEITEKEGTFLYSFYKDL